MELQHLRCVVAIADRGTFTEAAAALNVSQPTLSRAVAHLEDELDTRLFDRTPSGARLTAAGRALLGPARRAIAEVEGGREAVAAVTGVLGGELIVAGIQNAIIETGQLVARFHARHPRVYIVIEDPLGDPDVIDLVRTGRSDVGVMRTSHTPADLPSVAAGVQPMVAIFPEDRAPSMKAVTQHHLNEVGMLAPRPGTASRATFDAHLRAHGLHPRIVGECSNLNAFVELVRAGAGAAAISSSFAAGIDMTGIAVRAIEGLAPIELSAIRRPAASPAATAFFAMLLESAPGRAARRRGRT